MPPGGWCSIPMSGTRRTQPEPGAKEGSGDAIEDQDISTKGAGPATDSRSVERGQRKRSLRERDELEPAVVAWCQLDQALMVQIAARQSARVAERDQSDC